VTLGGGGQASFRPMEYIIEFFVNDIFFSDISVFGMITDMNINFKNKSFEIHGQHCL
jgi:hypothetical protein